MKQSLRTRLSLSYVFMVAVIVLLISIIANVMLETQFRRYVIQNQERNNAEVVRQISQQYKSSNNWDVVAIESIGVNALENGMIVSVSDESGKMIWNAREYNSGMCEDMMTHMASNMFSRYRNWQGGYVENSYPILKDGRPIGKVEIGYYGPFYFTDNDLIFINTLNFVFVGSGLASAIIAMVFGIIMARRLVKPITNVINTAERISGGDYDARNSETSSVIEINTLAHTINSLAENLGKQEALRKRLTADVAHELRTPLATLQSHLEAMIDGIWAADKKRLSSCHEEIMRINRLVGDLEKLAKYEGEGLILNKTSFNLSDLTRSILSNFEKKFKDKNIEINLTCEDLMINADKDKISQVIINILSNSLKYTNDGGTVDIRLISNHNNIEMHFCDTGIGLSKEDLPRIFERFYRVDKSRSRMTGGAGIGLAITKSIIDAHGGNIKVESELGRGTEFVICLPGNI